MTTCRFRTAVPALLLTVWLGGLCHAQTAVWEWLDSVIPKSREELEAGFAVQAQANGVEAKFSRPDEDPAKLITTAGENVPCGSQDSVYVYDYGHGPPKLVLESHGTREHDESITDVRVSRRDAAGDQLILTLRYAVQCGSSWNELAYDLFRLPPGAGGAVHIFGGEHDAWFGAAEPYQIRLAPDDLWMEIRDRSIDDGVHNRRHVLHYRITRAGVERIDPVAFEPRDFADEWLTRPWREMQSRSAGRLKAWHDRLTAGYVAGEFQSVQQCRKPERWQIAIALEPTVYFLVEQVGQNGFRMLDVSFRRQPGCR